MPRSRRNPTTRLGRGGVPPESGVTTTPPTPTTPGGQPAAGSGSNRGRHAGDARGTPRDTRVSPNPFAALRTDGSTSSDSTSSRSRRLNARTTSKESTAGGTGPPSGVPRHKKGTPPPGTPLPPPPGFRNPHSHDGQPTPGTVSSVGGNAPSGKASPLRADRTPGGTPPVGPPPGFRNPHSRGGTPPVGPPPPRVPTSPKRSPGADQGGISVGSKGSSMVASTLITREGGDASRTSVGDASVRTRVSVDPPGQSERDERRP